MKGNIQWPAVLLVVLKALVAALAAVQADQLLGEPIAQGLQHLGALAALGQPLPGNSALLSNSLALHLFETLPAVSV